MDLRQIGITSVLDAYHTTHEPCTATGSLKKFDIPPCLELKIKRLVAAHQTTVTQLEWMRVTKKDAEEFPAGVVALTNKGLALKEQLDVNFTRLGKLTFTDNKIAKEKDNKKLMILLHDANGDYSWLMSKFMRVRNKITSRFNNPNPIDSSDAPRLTQLIQSYNERKVETLGKISQEISQLHLEQLKIEHTIEEIYRKEIDNFSAKNPSKGTE